MYCLCFVLLYYYTVYAVLVILFFFFFFKQKTAYEMRISDWSSDVCSSDLRDIGAAGAAGDIGVDRAVDGDRRGAARRAVEANLSAGAEKAAGRVDIIGGQDKAADVDHAAGADQDAAGIIERSEEQTSELQSLMRISYAVFCLKKKKIQ